MARREFTKKTQRAALQRAGFRCEAVTSEGARCPAKVGDGAPVEFDHIVPDSMGGGADLDNAAALCPRCHKIKTATDATVRAEADRRRDAHDGIRTAPTRKIANRPMPKAAPRNPATAPLERPLPARVRPLYVTGA